MQVFDLHNHTSEGSHDATISVRELLTTAKQFGLDGVGITEHDTFDSAEIVSSVADELGFLSFVGIEISTDFGHFVVYGIPKSFWEVEFPAFHSKWLTELVNDREWVSIEELSVWLKNKVNYRLTWKARELVEETHKHGGVIIIEHPFSIEGYNTLGKIYRDWYRSNRIDDISKFIKFIEISHPKFYEILSRIDAVEVLNGGSRIKENRLAQVLAVEINKPGVGGSDSHTKLDVGLCGTKIKEDINSINDLIEVIKIGKVQPINLMS